MKTLKILVVAIIVVMAFFSDFSPRTSSLPFGFELVSEAEAVLGVRRRAARRGVAVGYAAGQADAQQQQSEAAGKDDDADDSVDADQTDSGGQNATTAQQPAAATSAPEANSGHLAEGTVVNTLPDGCTTQESGGIEYYHCGDNYFRAAFQGNNLVYVSTSPQQS